MYVENMEVKFLEAVLYVSDKVYPLHAIFGGSHSLCLSLSPPLSFICLCFFFLCVDDI